MKIQLEAEVPGDGELDEGRARRACEGLSRFATELLGAPASVQVYCHTWASGSEIEAARAKYGSNDLEIDDDAAASVADHGVWVAAWVWLEHGKDDSICECCGAPCAYDSEVCLCDDCQIKSVEGTLE